MLLLTLKGMILYKFCFCWKTVLNMVWIQSGTGTETFPKSELAVRTVTGRRVNLWPDKKKCMKKYLNSRLCTVSWRAAFAEGYNLLFGKYFQTAIYDIRSLVSWGMVLTTQLLRTASLTPKVSKKSSDSRVGIKKPTQKNPKNPKKTI